MAVTFTDKAAGELKRAARGARRLRCARRRPFTPPPCASCATSRRRRSGASCPSKALALRQIANALPAPYKFRPAGDLATEIEWAKNRRIPPDRYDGREPPIPLDLMQRVYREYERRKAAEGLVDFEDLLELTVRLFEENAEVRETFRAQYRAFTVDEVQDVNLLQQQLLDLWLGDRDDLCVVGDDYQAIYGFTGASPEYLLAMPSGFPTRSSCGSRRTTARRRRCLRSRTSSCPTSAAPRRRSARCSLTAPSPSCARIPTPEDEGAAIVAELRALDCPFEETAILARTNARLTDFEELLHDAGIPFQGSSLLERDAARRLTRRLERTTAPAAEAVRAAALDAGWLERVPDKLGEREAVRQQDLGRLVQLAAAVRRRCGIVRRGSPPRFAPGGDGAHGVNLLTLHRAKGLEFEAVFIPRLQEKELPSKQARTPAELAEERRLLYVGMTRAKRILWLTWSGKRSRFLQELGVTQTAPTREARVDRRRTTSPRLAARAGEGRQRSALRRVPRQRAARDRGGAPVIARRAVADRRRRPGEARALRP